jgi:hypothetical protein
VKKALVANLLILSVVACSDTTKTLRPESETNVAGATIVTADVIVTNSNDAGPGSFRDAITQASGNASVATIGFLPEVSTIALQSTVTYTGSQDLTVHANHATLDGSSAAGAAFLVETNGADLTIIGLNVRNAPAQGLQVNVLSTATGTVRIELNDVEITDNAGHGVLVNDQENPDDVANSNGSSAAVVVVVRDSRFVRNGYSVSDRDGVRVNEGGDGSLTFTIWNSRSDDNAADGIELDERAGGDVVIDVNKVAVTRNGKFDPTDLDDGFDIDEAGPGHILGSVRSSSANHNFEEGLDFNENDAGDLRVDMSDVEANDNREEGIDLEEDDDFAGGGDLVTVMDRVTTSGNGVDGGDGGLKIREKGLGNLDVVLTNVIASQNSLAGIHLRETEAGDSRVSIDGAVATGNTGSTGHGIELREGSSGNITAAIISNVTASGNSGYGVSAENGTVNIRNVKGGANGGGLTGGGASFVVVP